MTNVTKKGINNLTLPRPGIPNKSLKKLPIAKEEIEYLETLKDKDLVFSFRFLELNHEIFNLGGTCNRWSNDLFELLNNLSKITRNDFVNKLQRHYRSHIHNWDKLDYKYGLEDEFLEQVECRQARISTSKGGIHGFVLGNRFYVIWLDPHHNLYPDDRYGGVKNFSPPETCCGYRDSELESLKKIIEGYEELLEEQTSPT